MNEKVKVPEPDRVLWYGVLDNIVRDYEKETNKLPSKTTVLELIQWLRKKAEVKNG